MVEVELTSALLLHVTHLRLADDLTLLPQSLLVCIGPFLIIQLHSVVCRVQLSAKNSH